MPNYRRTTIRSKARGWMFVALPAAATLALLVTAAPAAAADAKAAATYTDSCADCHGQTGKGDGPSASKLSAKVGDFTDCAHMAKVSDDVIFKIIKEGGPAANLNAAMPPFGEGMEDAEIKGLVAYLRSFCKK